MRRLILALMTVLSLAVTATAAAGGWATAGLGPPGGGISAGDTWNADVTILQHGQTPLVGVQPTVTIRNDAGVVRTFPARPTGKPGVYRAQVKFPSGGEWRYEVYDGFTQYGGAKAHKFAPITIGGSGAGSDASFPLVPSAAGAMLALLAIAGLIVFVRRQRRAGPVPA